MNDRIEVIILSGTKVDDMLPSYQEYIARQVQANNIIISDAVSDATPLEFDDFNLMVSIAKVTE